MITVVCLLKSGGVYTVEWVEKLKRGVKKHLTIPHYFRCVSDVEVPDRIPLEVEWPKWWGKIFLFRRGLFPLPALYLDLDTVITGSLVDICRQSQDFSMLQNFKDPQMVGSGVMWFNKVPYEVYEKFSQDPLGYIKQYREAREGSYIGDQAFIFDTVQGIYRVSDQRIRSYKVHCQEGLPVNTSLVCFHGRPRPDQVRHEWVKEHWL